jgi:hypothetical protein
LDLLFSATIAPCTKFGCSRPTSGGSANDVVRLQIAGRERRALCLRDFIVHVRQREERILLDRYPIAQVTVSDVGHQVLCVPRTRRFSGVADVLDIHSTFAIVA